MKTFNFGNMHLTPAHIIKTTAGVDGIVSAAMSQAQKRAWELACVVCAVSLGHAKFDPNEFPDLPKQQFTLGGHPLVIDDTLDEAVIEFRDVDGICLVRLEALAIPSLT